MAYTHTPLSSVSPSFTLLRVTTKILEFTIITRRLSVEYHPRVQSGVALPKVKVGSPGPDRNNGDSPLQYIVVGLPLLFIGVSSQRIQRRSRSSNFLALTQGPRFLVVHARTLLTDSSLVGATLVLFIKPRQLRQELQS